MIPVRLQLSRAKGFNLQQGSMLRNGLSAVNVARPSLWGNPFVVGKDGTRAECVQLFKYMISGNVALSTKASVDSQKAFLNHAHAHWKDLRGKNIACWCPGHAECHADVLLVLANKPVKEPA